MKRATPRPIKWGLLFTYLVILALLAVYLYH